MTSDRIHLGVLTPIYLAIGVIFTGATAFLGVIPWDQLAISFVVFFLGGIFLILISGRLSMVQESDRLGVPVLLSIALTLGLLGIESWLLWNFFSMSIEVPANPIIAVLFAIYEETLFLGIAAILKLSGLPDLYLLIISTLIFVPLHAWVYAQGWIIDATLALARLTFSGLFFIVDNSDVPYTSHILWNILATV